MAISEFLKKLVKNADETTETAAEAVEAEAEEVKAEVQDHVHGHRPPEPPKDENGNPVQPPEGFRPPMGHRPPEPPKDENCNPIRPPEGMTPPPGWEKPAEATEPEASET